MRLLSSLTIACTILALTLFGALLSSPAMALEGPNSGSKSNAPIISLDDLELLSDAVVVEVRVEGNKRVSDSDIRVNIATRPGMMFDRERIARDIRALHDLGFFSDVQVSASRVGDELTLYVLVTERPAIAEVRYEGNDEVDEEDISEVVDLSSNAPLDIPTIHRNAQKIRDLYTEKGFFLAEVTHRLDESSENAFDVVFIVDEHAQVEVRRISFVGNKEISDSEIGRYLATRTSGPLSFLTESGTFRREAFEQDLTRITAVYWDKGFLDVKVGNPQVELSPDKRYIFLSIPVEEGPRYKIGRVRVQERTEAGDEMELLGGRRKVRSLVRSERGSWFSRTSLMEDVERLSRHYQDAGYANVNVNPQTFTNPETRVVDLVYDITRGDKVFFERIEVRGNTKTRDRVIRREISVHEGDRFSQTGIEISKARVTQLGFFERVDITTSPGSSSDKVVVTVEVAERHTGQFQVGMGFSSVENFIAQAQITEQNFLGQGQMLSLQAQISSLRQIFMLNFWEPYLFDSKWTFAFKLYDTIMAQIDYNKESTGGEITLGHSLLTRDLKLFLTYKLSYDQVDTGQDNSLLISGRRFSSGFSELPLAHLFEEGLSSSVKALLSYDKRNNRLFPTKGSFNTVSAEWASPYLGSDFNFARFTFNTRWYQPVFWKVIFRFNGWFGLVNSYDPEGLAIVHRYRSGGIMDVRGFYPWSLGPRISIPDKFDPNAEPMATGINIGGNMKITLNAELEFPIVEMAGLKGVVFFDAGNSFNLEDTWCGASGGRGIHSFNDPCNSNPLYMRTSAGFGFRWFSPLGPLRFEWGFPTKTYAGEEDFMFEFMFGNFF